MRRLKRVKHQMLKKPRSSNIVHNTVTLFAPTGGDSIKVQ